MVVRLLWINRSEIVYKKIKIQVDLGRLRAVRLLQNQRNCPYFAPHQVVSINLFCLNLHFIRS